MKPGHSYATAEYLADDCLQINAVDIMLKENFTPEGLRLMGRDDLADEVDADANQAQNL